MDGVVHKRRVITQDECTMLNPALVGKRTFQEAKAEQGVGELLKVGVSARGEQPGPSVRETRFHRGFQRKAVPHRDCPLSLVSEVVEPIPDPQPRRREMLANQWNASGLNPITCGPPIVGRSQPEDPPLRGIRPLESIKKSHRILEEPSQHRGTRRITPPTRDWSVADQFSTYDGFPVSTEIATNGTRRRAHPTKPNELCPIAA
eukprot:GGOE01036722.1.p1 GENE.GGOE01036722.1~~GGOE01036722.1.p1  ORF type:complete len:204 (+),score=9.69 GGOE01036722.1:74-685(+)